MLMALRSRFLAAGLLAASLGGICATASAQDISETHLKAARDAIASIRATDQFDLILPQASGALKAELIRKDPNLQQIISATVDEKTLELAGRRADLEREAALAYARVFSEAELTAIAAFYNSEAGKKLIADGPIVTREVVRAADIWSTGVSRDLAEAVAKVLQSVAPQQPAPDPAAPVLTPSAGSAPQQ